MPGAKSFPSLAPTWTRPRPTCRPRPRKIAAGVSTRNPNATNDAPYADTTSSTTGSETCTNRLAWPASAALIWSLISPRSKLLLSCRAPPAAHELRLNDNPYRHQTSVDEQGAEVSQTEGRNDER